MKCNYVAPEITLLVTVNDVVTASGIPEGVNDFNMGWIE